MGTPNTIQSLPEEYRWKNNETYEDAFNLYSLFLGINTEGLKEKVPSSNTWYFPKKPEDDFKTYDEYYGGFIES